MKYFWGNCERNMKYESWIVRGGAENEWNIFLETCESNMKYKTNELSVSIIARVEFLFPRTRFLGGSGLTFLFLKVGRGMCPCVRKCSLQCSIKSWWRWDYVRVITATTRLRWQYWHSALSMSDRKGSVRRKLIYSRATNGTFETLFGELLFVLRFGTGSNDALAWTL